MVYATLHTLCKVYIKNILNQYINNTMLLDIMYIIDYNLVSELEATHGKACYDRRSE